MLASTAAIEDHISEVQFDLSMAQMWIDSGAGTGGEELRDEYAAHLAFLRWVLGQGASPLFGTPAYSDDDYFREYRATLGIIENNEPVPAGVSVKTYLGVYRAARWLRDNAERVAS